MSYARFSEGDVYVFTSSEGIECCGCYLQERVWVKEPGTILGGYLKEIGEIIPYIFRSNQEMIDHLMIHREAGHDVPEDALERLRDPEDEAENKEIWRKADAERESRDY